MQDAKEEVRARLDIEDVIGEYVQLKRAGRNFKGLSPFTGEKTASFFVSPEKHIWHDFSSNKGGDVFAFIMEVEGMDFRQALEHLARRAGVDLTQYESRGSRDVARRKQRLHEAHELATTYYQQSLRHNPRATDYVLKKRGLMPATIKEFRLGYAPDTGDALTAFLTKRGFSKQELAAAGLTNRFGGDLFRGRMMVPLMDGGGQVVGFTGRIIHDEPNAPKYLNTPATLIYDKSRHVFGLSQAKAAIREAEYAVIVEGNLDVISSHQAGAKQVVATAGTAMTEYHLKALRRLASEARLSFDSDKAGIAATERAIPLAERVGIMLTIITLPGESKDPDELIKQDAALWRTAIETARPAVEWVLERYQSLHDLATAAGKRAYTSAGLAVVRNLPDAVEREHYLTQISGVIDTSVAALEEKMRSGASESTERRRAVRAPSVAPVPESPDRSQDAFLAVALGDVYLQDLFRRLSPEVFRGEASRAVAAYLRDHPGEVVASVPEGLRDYEKYVTMLLLHQDVGRLEWSAEHRLTTAGVVIRQLEEQYQKRKTETLQRLSDEARDQGDEARANEYLRQINQIIKGESRAGQ